MINSGLYSSDKSNWATPQWLFDELDSHYHFTLDPCAEYWNHKCDKWYGEEQDGLKQDWTGERVFMNPPYGRDICGWVYKALSPTRNLDAAVLLLPARTDTRWFCDNIFERFYTIGFIKGRLRFERWEDGHLRSSPAPFPSCIVLRGCNPFQSNFIYWMEAPR